MNADVFACIATEDKNLIFSVTHQLSECNSRIAFFNILQSTLIPLLHLDGIFIVRFNDQSGQSHITGTSETINIFSPTLGALINQIIINDRNYCTVPGIAIGTTEIIETPKTGVNSKNEWLALKNNFKNIAGIFDIPTPTIGLWFYRKGAYTDIFKQREINILKYLRPILLQVIKSLIFQEEKEKYYKIAEYFISSNKPQAVIKHDGSILVCNNKFTNQITQSNITALPPQLQKKIANFISHQSLLSKNSSDKENPVYIRFNHRLYQTNISAITQDHQLSDSTWLLTLNRISNIDSILQRTLFDAKVTKRETEIIRLLQTGISSADVANQLEISYHTTRTHVRNIYKKLGVSSSRELLAFLHQPSII